MSHTSPCSHRTIAPKPFTPTSHYAEDDTVSLRRKCFLGGVPHLQFAYIFYPTEVLIGFKLKLKMIFSLKIWNQSSLFILTINLISIFCNFQVCRWSELLDFLTIDVFLDLQYRTINVKFF